MLKYCKIFGIMSRNRVNGLYFCGQLVSDGVLQRFGTVGDKNGERRNFIC